MILDCAERQVKSYVVCHTRAKASPAQQGTALLLFALALVPFTGRLYWTALAACEKTVLAFVPIRRIVPTTKTRMTANITAYSAMSWPCSSDHNLRINSDILSSGGLGYLNNEAGNVS